MITKFKIYENKVNVSHLLCVRNTDPDYYYKFTKGKKYKYYSNTNRLKDDNGKFVKIDHWSESKDGTVKYADGIFTTDNSIEDYKIRTETDKYNL